MPVPAWMASLMKPWRFFRKTASRAGLAPWNTPAMPSGCIPMLVRCSTRLSVGPSVHKAQTCFRLCACCHTWSCSVSHHDWRLPMCHTDEEQAVQKPLQMPAISFAQPLICIMHKGHLPHKRGCRSHHLQEVGQHLLHGHQSSQRRACRRAAAAGWMLPPLPSALACLHGKPQRCSLQDPWHKDILHLETPAAQGTSRPYCGRRSCSLKTFAVTRNLNMG